MVYFTLEHIYITFAISKLVEESQATRRGTTRVLERDGTNEALYLRQNMASILPSRQSISACVFCTGALPSSAALTMSLERHKGVKDVLRNNWKIRKREQSSFEGHSRMQPLR